MTNIKTTIMTFLGHKPQVESNAVLATRERRMLDDLYKSYSTYYLYPGDNICLNGTETKDISNQDLIYQFSTWDSSDIYTMKPKVTPFQIDSAESLNDNAIDLSDKMYSDYTTGFIVLHKANYNAGLRIRNLGVKNFTGDLELQMSIVPALCDRTLENEPYFRFVATGCIAKLVLFKTEEDLNFYKSLKISTIRRESRSVHRKKQWYVNELEKEYF